MKRAYCGGESAETVTVHRHEELMGEIEQHYAEEVSVWKVSSLENVDSLTINVKVTKADGDEMSIEWNLIVAHFE